MDQVVEIVNLIKDDTIEVRLHRLPSYIQPFVSQPIDEDIVLVYKKLVTRSVTTNGVTRPDCSVDLDLTGSPLAYPFTEDDYYDDTIISGPLRHWLKDEESHGSLPVIKARKILSLCNLHAHCWKVPVWVVCDGSDLQQSILLSAFCDRKSGWVTRSNVRLLGHWSYKQVEEYAVHVRKEHLSISRIPGHEMKTHMTHVYDIQGAMGSYEKSTQCSISVRLSWSSSSFITSPPIYADAVVEMHIVMEQATSAACKLWKQLKLLHQLVAVLALSKRKQESDCIELPRLEYDNGNSIRIETADIISLLHEMDYTAVRCQGTRDSVQEAVTALPLNLFVTQALHSKSTLYLDFTHHLFLLLTNCRDSENLAKCLLLIFQEVQSGNAKLFVHPKNPTKVAHIVRELMQGGSALPELTGIKSIELLLEIGLEKLSKDYTHIFLSSDLATLEQLKLPSCNVNELNEVYNITDVLGRLHVTLEILLLAESQMKFSLSSLQPLAAFTLNNIEAQVESLSKLMEVGHIKFEAPVATKEVQWLLTRRYSSSCMRLTSEGDVYKLCTILNCSAFPLFPFVSADFSDSQLCDENGIHDEDLHCSQLTCLANKLL